MGAEIRPSSALLRATIVAALAISTLACRPDTPVAEFDHAGFDVADVPLQTLAAGEAFGIPWQVRVLNDSTLVVADFQSPHLHVVERATGRVLASFGRAGRGPGEYISQPEVAVTSSRQYPVVAWSQDLARITLVSLDRSSSRPDSTISVLISGSTRNPIALADTALLLSRATDTTAIAAVNLRLGTWTLSGKPMAYIPSDSLTPFARTALPGELTMCANDERTLLFRASRIAGRAEITDITATRVDTLEVPYAFEPFYEWDPEYGGYVAQWTRAQRKGYVDCATDGEYIFALFSGRRNGSFSNAYERLLAHYVHVFRWDGTLVKVLRLSQPAFSIAFDAKSNTLYAAIWDPDPAIVVAELNALIP
ncbi:MAG TPA: BF3164 family lipoprotein [Gemmatimonadaceae bacterium]|nr:BF3164 family lipoprotein [Gemmatimonadaceae bacterium]HRQ77716.1 BF3164 family lipoprotein [Gemmatimonadaceae bacterium]